MLRHAGCPPEAGRPGQAGDVRPDVRGPGWPCLEPWSAAWLQLCAGRSGPPFPPVQTGRPASPPSGPTWPRDPPETEPDALSSRPFPEPWVRKAASLSPRGPQPKPGSGGWAGGKGRDSPSLVASHPCPDQACRPSAEALRRHSHVDTWTELVYPGGGGAPETRAAGSAPPRRPPSAWAPLPAREVFSLGLLRPAREPHTHACDLGPISRTSNDTRPPGEAALSTPVVFPRSGTPCDPHGNVARQAARPLRRHARKRPGTLPGRTGTGAGAESNPGRRSPCGEAIGGGAGPLWVPSLRAAAWPVAQPPQVAPGLLHHLTEAPERLRE